MTTQELATKHKVTTMMISLIKRAKDTKTRTTSIKLAKDMAKIYGGSPKDYFSIRVLKSNPNLEKQLK